MGIGEPSLSSSWPLSIFSSGWLWVEVSDLLNHVFPIELKLENKNPLSQETYLTIPNLRGGNMGIGEPFLSSSQPLSISSSRWLWVEVLELLNHVFPIELKPKSQNPLSQETFSQFWTLEVKIWVQGNLPSLSHNLSQFPFLSDYGSKFQTCYVFVLFLHFCY